MTRVRSRPRSATIDVDYDERCHDGDLARAARDRAHALTHPARRRPRGVQVSVTHVVAGRARLEIAGVSADELARLAAWLAEQPGVLAAAPGASSIVVRWANDDLDPAATARAIAASDPSEWPPSPPPADESPWRALCFDGAVLLAARRRFVPRSLLALAVAVSAEPTARRALRAVGERRLSVDLLDLLAIIVSVAAGAPGTAALITLLLSAGDYILHLTKRRAHGALAGAIKLEVPTAWKLRPDGQAEAVSTKTLVVGDRIVCDLGGRLPVDGVITSGAATIDTKALTGESTPRTCQSGDSVMASSVVVEGSIVVEVRRVGRDTTAGRIVQILESAGDKPTYLQRETERVADQLVMPTLGLAGAAALLASEIDRMTSVLITDFGTGIRISVPTSALAAMTVATRDGVLVKGGQFLERLARADAVVFDKTGTLTSGTPRVVDVVAVDGFDPSRAIALAAAVETRQSHPVAEALRAHTRAHGIAVPHGAVRDQSYAVGQGLVARCGSHEVAVGGARLMSARGITIDGARAALERHERSSVSSLLIAVDGRLAAVLGYADAVRPESRGVIRALAANGRRRIVLMSGDASGPATEIGRCLGVDEVYSELLPHEKAEHVRRLQRAGRVVAMVGDGINDAPALALADVGISLTGGTDVALDAADVVLLSGGLSKLPTAFRIADDAMRAVRTGLGIVIVPNALAIVLGALGVIGPGVATVLNNGSTVVAAMAALSPVLRRPRTTA
ncbi:MAG: heavy metal translocating P-type ATPase [Labilithrix sp.]|nr:heavy metal translocating P-type ATPase [Labilithrix sp.]MBX3221337.1 heavy metal translocating P-type ATPase [Labilithrix sp.]